MPVSYQIEPSPGFVIVTLEGIVTNKEVVDGQQRMFRDPLFDGTYSRLIDATKVTELLVNAVTVRAVARAATERGMRRVALVANSGFVYAMMRMYEGYAREAECWVGHDVNEALAWLLSLRPGGGYPGSRGG